MDQETALTWAVHHTVVDYYHKLIDSVRKNIQTPRLKFEDFYPVAKERVAALMPFIEKNKLSCIKEARKILGWNCRESVEIEVINLVTALNERVIDE